MRTTLDSLPAPALSADFDEDNDADGGGFLVWQRQLGSTLPTADDSAAPEPASTLLAALPALGNCRHKSARPQKSSGQH
jgi:hypothetical protein